MHHVLLACWTNGQRPASACRAHAPRMHRALNAQPAKDSVQCVVISKLVQCQVYNLFKMPPKRMNPLSMKPTKKTPSAPVIGGRGRRGKGRGKELPSLDPEQPSLNPELHSLDSDSEQPSLNPEPPSLDPELHSLDSAFAVEDAVEDATSFPSSSRQCSPTHSHAGSVDSHVSLASQTSSVVKIKKGTKKDKRANKLSDDEEELMVAFLEENEMIWNKKVTHYRRPDMKNAAWQKQADIMSKEVSHLQGSFKGMRDNFARLENLPKSGSGQREFTEYNFSQIRTFS